MRERLLQLLELLKMTPTQFSNAVGIQRSTLQHIIGGRNEVSLKVVMAIHDSYPDFNSEWLLYGTGQPFMGELPKVDPENQGYPLFSQSENQEIPTPVRNESDFSNVKGETEPVCEPERADNKPVEVPFMAMQNTKGKSVKEIIVFFDDGTFETFRS